MDQSTVTSPSRRAVASFAALTMPQGGRYSRGAWPRMSATMRAPSVISRAAMTGGRNHAFRCRQVWFPTS